MAGEAEVETEFELLMLLLLRNPAEPKGSAREAPPPNASKRLKVPSRDAIAADEVVAE